MEKPSSHFDRKKALEHVVQKRMEGILSLSESHGLETPGHISAGADAVRETAAVLFFTWLLFYLAGAPEGSLFKLLICFSSGWLIWKTGRSAWLGWFRLERLHRIIEQEKYEIEHHREQEREEILALYRAKGFEGKLLEDVADVLMADQDRLLNVMLEEELGLTLQAYEHPLKQSLGAAIGTLAALCFVLLSLYLLPHFGISIASLLLLGSGAALSALYDKNRAIAAVVWNCSMGIMAAGMIFFLSKLIF